MKKFKRSFFAVVASVLVCAGALSGCGSSANSENKIVVGASVTPHAEILKAAAPILEKEGYTLEIKEFSDYIQPNVALESGELDANFFQHKPYLDEYNAQKGTKLVDAGAIHFEPLTIFAGKSKDLKNIKQGAKISVPSDTTNEARALLLLQSQGIIKLKDGAGLSATKNDIVSNPYNIDIVEAEAASLPRSLEDVDFGVINGNYALSSGLDASRALVSEDATSEAAKTYANIIATTEKNKDSKKIQALVSALQSAEVRQYINETYQGKVVPVF